jgi:hypothetical protein
MPAAPVARLRGRRARRLGPLPRAPQAGRLTPWRGFSG